MLEVKDYDAPELLGELLLFEISPEYCRDALTIKAAGVTQQKKTIPLPDDNPAKDNPIKKAE